MTKTKGSALIITAWIVIAFVVQPAALEGWQVDSEEPVQNFKDRIENDPLIWLLGMAVTAFAAGAMAVRFIDQRARPVRISEEPVKAPPAEPVVDTEGVIRIYPRTNKESEEDLIGRILAARRSVRIFGLTRNFFAGERMRPILAQKAHQLPVHMYMMDPACDSRRDRYRIEPLEAAFEDPDRYRKFAEGPFRNLIEQLPESPATSSRKGISIYYYNFPCSFAIEEIDDVVRVMLYGHAKRGTEGPIFLFRTDSQIGQYFVSQLDWVESLALGPTKPWSDNDIVVRQLSIAD